MKLTLEDLTWYVRGEHEALPEGFKLLAKAGADYFVTPAEGEVYADAVFGYVEVEGDFVFRAEVSLEMVSTYDAAVLLAMDHERLWAKACFELTDLGYPAVVTVFTDERSDDANGVKIDGDTVWLQLARKNDEFAIHYSRDGETFHMARYGWLPMAEKLKVGVEAQSPTGSGGWRIFRHVTLERKTLADIRDGNR